MRRERGFTLTEMLLVVSLAFLVMTAAISLLVGAARVSREYDQRRLARQNLRDALSITTAEARQAMADPDPAGSGYLGLSPSVAATGFLMPNANVRSANTLILTIPNRTTYDPSRSGWNANSPDNYKKVRYYVAASGVLHREETSFNASGSPLSITDAVVVSARDGSLALATTWLSPTTVGVSITSSEGGFRYTLDTVVNAVCE